MMDSKSIKWGINIKKYIPVWLRYQTYFQICKIFILVDAHLEVKTRLDLKKKLDILKSTLRNKSVWFEFL